jgi:peroxiredoxin Q/BCP
VQALKSKAGAAAKRVSALAGKAAPKSATSKAAAALGKPAPRGMQATSKVASSSKAKTPASKTDARSAKTKVAASKLESPGVRAGAAASASAKSVAKRAAANEKGGLAVGDRAPAFKLVDDTGKLVSSESLRGSSYVLYFYPKDDTPGCTLQACGFRDSLPRFSAKGVKVLGVSPDPVSAHERFKKKYGLTFPLLSDADKTLANAYGVWVKKQNYGREYMGIERSTFVVDGKGVIRQAYRGVRVPGHVDAVLGSV